MERKIEYFSKVVFVDGKIRYIVTCLVTCADGHRYLCEGFNSEGHPVNVRVETDSRGIPVEPCPQHI